MNRKSFKNKQKMNKTSLKNKKMNRKSFKNKQGVFIT
jgi:hypothetical protein